MKKLINVNDIFKILIIYVITTLVSMVVASLIVNTNSVLKDELKDYLWVIVIFTIIFLMLIRLFKVNFKSVAIYLGVSMFMLLFVFLNLNQFSTIASTPDEPIFPIMYFIARFTTIPFLGVIQTLVGYDRVNFSYIVLPLYIMVLTLLSYITLNFNDRDYTK